jgi:hypothetical protein
MRTVMTTLGLAVVLASCENQKLPDPPKPPPAQSPAAQPARAASAPAPTAAGVKGKVLETIDAAGYTYLRLETASGEQWAAITQTTVQVGAVVEIVDATMMRDFESKTLNRTFPAILFGSLGNGAAGAEAAAPAPVEQAQLPPGHPPMSPAPQALIGEIKVDKAKAANGKTVAEVWTDRAKLTGQKVSVQGKVVKVSTGVMGKNWLHLRDGSGSDAAKDNDLTVTSQGLAAVGDVVTAEGVVYINKDFGAGYSYPVIVEEATVQK